MELFGVKVEAPRLPSLSEVRDTVSSGVQHAREFGGAAVERAKDLGRQGVDLGRRAIQDPEGTARQLASSARQGIHHAEEAVQGGIRDGVMWTGRQIHAGAETARSAIPGDNAVSRAARGAISYGEHQARFTVGAVGGVAKEAVGLVGTAGSLAVTGAEMQVSPTARAEVGQKIAGAVESGARSVSDYAQSAAADPSRIGRDLRSGAQSAWNAGSGFVEGQVRRHEEAYANGQGPETLGMTVGQVGSNFIPIGGGAKLAATAARGAEGLAVAGGRALAREAVEGGARTVAREGTQAVAREGAQLVEQRGAALVDRMAAGGGTATLEQGAGRVADLAAASRQSGRELAVYRDGATGQRLVTMGAADQVSVPAGSRLIAHTQPGVGPAALAPSAADRAALGALGQRSSAIVDQGGNLSRFGIDAAAVASSSRAASGELVTVRAPEVPATNIAGDAAQVAGRTDPALIAQNPLLTSAPNAHAVPRHGGVVTDEQLMQRARTGLTPDGYQAAQPPRLSTAFHSDALLVSTDKAIRQDGALQAAIAAAPPGAARVTVTPAMVGDLGQDLGRGFERLGTSPDLQGPLNLVEDLRSAQGVYGRDAVSGNWETITLYPERVVP